MDEVMHALDARPPAPAAHSGSLADGAVAPYLDAVRRYAAGHPTRLTVPGHKGGLAAPVSLLGELGDDVPSLDIPQLIDGVDRETGRLSPFEVAERRAAVAWGAARTWFLTGGATQGNLAACLAVAFGPRRVAVQRSSHSSTFNGLTLAGLRPTSVMPEVDPHLGVAHGVTPQTLDAALTTARGIQAVFVTSPTYFGACADVAGLADVAHRHGAALIVDEAWGAHLRFSGALPPDALSCGADLVVSSTHKHLGSLGGSAMLHLGAGAPEWLSEDRVGRALGLVTSTSPSSLLLSSLDSARARAEHEGAPLLAMAARELADVREAIRTIPGLDVVDERFVGRPGFAGLDPLRLTIDVRWTGRTGHEIAADLRATGGVELELAQERVVVAVFGLGESPAQSAEPLVDGLARLSTGWRRAVAVREARATAVQAVADAPENAAPLGAAAAVDPGGAAATARRREPRATRTPREATLAPCRLVPIEEAHGCVAAEALVPYPPGIPAVLPGEVIDGALLLDLREQVLMGATLRGCTDPWLGKVLVVDDPLAELESTARVGIPGLA